ncbi:hypothetical protein P0R31_33975 [Bradyrhizobium yuanmingense]|nr:hypothetical protein [Bradyrhizobium yuanmingense]MDF0522251.1 hypothetical protein [Bradyrhizobium yuanmingense]
MTLQFVGRFTRGRNDLGNATVIANIAHHNAAEALQDIYAVDADWNALLSVVGTKLTEREERRGHIPWLFRRIRRRSRQHPASRMSTVVYRTTCAGWRPLSVADAIIKSSSIIDGPVVNDEARLVLFVTRDAGERHPCGCDPTETVLSEPAGEIYLARVLPVWMDPDVLDRLGSEQVHGVG